MKVKVNGTFKQVYYNGNFYLVDKVNPYRTMVTIVQGAYGVPPGIKSV